jgi:hypothetical protein
VSSSDRPAPPAVAAAAHGTDDSFRGVVTRVRRNWRQTLGPFVPFAAMLATLATALATGPLNIGKDGVSFFFLLLVSAVVPVVLQLMGFGVHRDAKDVVADAAGLRSGTAMLLARTHMAEGYLRKDEPGRVGVRIVGQNGGRTLDLEVDTRERALALLRALRLDVLHRTFEVRGYCTRGDANLPPRIVVGADGVLVTREGFFLYADIRDVVRDGSVVVLQLVAGSDVRLLTTLGGDALLERLREGLEAFRRGEHADDACALVSRRGRSLRAWMKDLAGLMGDHEYRTASLTPEILWRIAEDPAASTTARTGAAVALRSTLDDSGRERLRIAAAASASPKLRVVLEAAAEQEEGPLVRAVEDCKEES